MIREAIKSKVSGLIANLKAERVSSKDLNQLVFGQQHLGTQQFFIEKYGQYHTILLNQFPHYLFLKNNLDNPFSDHIYAKYLKASWQYLYGEANTSELRAQRIKEFINLYDSIAKRKEYGDRAIKLPITLCERPDGKLIIIHGNHRAAIALRLGLDVRVNIIDYKKHLQKITFVPDEFYGAGRLHMPYQSVFDGEVELVRGRRPDTLERMKMMDEEDLKNKSVLDFGCNIGSSCYLAIQFGVCCATGVDYSPKLISAAIRLNSYFAKPCGFLVHDLNKELSNVEPADTVFCFSIAEHIKNKSALVKTIAKNTKSVLYFEGHSNTAQKDYDYLLNKKYFSKIELIGYLKDAVDSKSRTRPFFRCEICK